MSSIESLSDRALGQAVITGRNVLNRAKFELEMLEAEVVRRKAVTVQTLLDASNKASGTVSFEDGDLLYKGEVSKKVEWDGDKLRAIAAKMPWITAEKVFDIKFSVPERVFSAITDESLLAQLNDARTVKYGTPVVKFVGFKEG